MIRKEELMPFANKKLLELIKKQADGNVMRFAKKVDMSQQRINRTLVPDKKSGKFPSLSEEVRTKCIETFHLDANYFLEPEGNDYIERQNATSIAEKDEMLPHISTKVTAGGIGGMSDCIMRNDCEYRPVMKLIPKYDMTIDVKGDSMLPKYENGDIIAIRRVVDIIEWGGVYVLDTVDGAVLKRLYDNGDSFRCVSYNKEFQDYFVEKRNVYGVYKVVGQIRL